MIQAFSGPNELAPSPPPPLSRYLSSNGATYRKTEKERQLVHWRGGKGVGGGTKKAWSSVNHSVLSDVIPCFHKVAPGEGGGAAVPGWRVPGLQLTPSLHRLQILLQPLQSTPPQVHCSAVPGWRVPGLQLTPSLHRLQILLQPLQSTPPQVHCSAVPGWRVPGLQLTPSLHRLPLLLQPLQSTSPQVVPERDCSERFLNLFFLNLLLCSPSW